MRALKIIIIIMLFFSAIAVQAQMTVNVDTGSPPPWGPVGYTDARYYYLPDVESYYDVHATMFICFVEGAWVHRAHLPSRYKRYDLYKGYKVVITDYHGSAPYANFKEHKAKYAKGYHGPKQKTIGEKPGKENTNSKNSDNGKRRNKNAKDKNNGQGTEKNNRK